MLNEAVPRPLKLPFPSSETSASRNLIGEATVVVFVSGVLARAGAQVAAKRPMRRALSDVFIG